MKDKDADISDSKMSIKDKSGYAYAVFQIFKQNLISAYAQSFLWFLWIFIIPVSKMLLFLFLRKNNVIAGNDVYLPYPLYVFFSLILWQIFVHIITNSCSVFNKYSNLLTLDFPREILIYGNACVALFNAFLLLFLFIVISLIYKVPPHVGIVYLPVIFFFIALFAVGLVKIISILSLITRDIAESMVLILMFFMFATPAIYIASPGQDNFISYFNPLHVFIKTAHLLWAGDSSKITNLFYFHCFAAGIIFCFAAYFFRKSIYIALERM